MPLGLGYESWIFSTIPVFIIANLRRINNELHSRSRSY
nr:MAG TPA: hypothetical protein [Caudoviricetes sp.]